MLENGLPVKCTDMEYLSGQMDLYMMVNINLGKEKVKESFVLHLVTSMKGAGKMGSNME